MTKKTETDRDLVVTMLTEMRRCRDDAGRLALHCLLELGRVHGDKTLADTLEKRLDENLQAVANELMEYGHQQGWLKVGNGTVH